LTYSKPYSHSIGIEEINGVSRSWAGVIELLPGKYEICAGYYDTIGSTIYYSTECVKVGLNAEAGKTYIISPVIDFDKGKWTWHPIITDISEEQSTRKEWIDNYINKQKMR
jgi:hypothetical protein